jgi:branched-chain amino acid transport system permease protein
MNAMLDTLQRWDDQRRRSLDRWSNKWRDLPAAPKRAAVVAIGIALVLLAIPEQPFLLNTPNNRFTSVLAYQVISFVMLAIGLNVVVGHAGLLDLGYVGFFAIGAYTTGILTAEHASIPWLAALPIAIAVAMVAGVILGTPTLRLRGDYLAIVTLGFGEIIRITARTTQWLGRSEGIRGVPHPPSITIPLVGWHLDFGVLDPKPYYWLGLFLITIIVFAVRRIERSRVGRYWVAIREDEDAAELMGVPTFRYKLWAFAIGAAVGGIGGAYFAGHITSFTPDTFDVTLSILYLAAVVLGGAGNTFGVIVGAVLVSYLPERFRFLDERRYLVFGLALVLMMIFRPQGLIPNRRRAAEIEHPSTAPDFPGVSGSDMGEPIEPHTGSMQSG